MSRTLGRSKEPAEQLLPLQFGSEHVQETPAAVDGLAADDFLTSEMCDTIGRKAISKPYAHELGFAAGEAENRYHP